MIFVMIIFSALQYIQNCKEEDITCILLQLIFHSMSEFICIDVDSSTFIIFACVESRGMNKPQFMYHLSRQQALFSPDFHYLEHFF